jgi:hypothetical protein
MISQPYAVYRLLLLVLCAILGIAQIHLAYLFALFNYLSF